MNSSEVRDRPVVSLLPRCRGHKRTFDSPSHHGDGRAPRGSFSTAAGDIQGKVLLVINTCSAHTEEGFLFILLAVFFYLSLVLFFLPSS